MKYLRNLRNFIERIPPKTVVFTFYFSSAWLILGSLGQLLAVWSELFSGEEVVNFW